jgi:hypothetical protein
MGVRMPAEKPDRGVVRTLAGRGQNRYIGRNLQFLIYDRVVRVGPFRTRSFLLPETASLPVMGA